MCSGCSGDYAGEFDDSGEPTPDFDVDARPAMNCGEPQGHGNQQSTSKPRAFDGDANAERCPQEETASRRGDQAAADFCEILVSGTRILEIRVIEANGGEIGQWATIEAAESSAAPKHSRGASAKYYRTRPMDAGNGGVRLKQSRSFWAAEAKGEVRSWLRWARRALGTVPAKSF